MMPKMKPPAGKLVWSKRGIMLPGPNMELAPFAPPILVRATVSVDGLPDKFVIVDFLDYAKKRISVKLPRADFLDFHKLKRALEGAGYEFPRDPSAGKKLHEFIVGLAPRERWRLVDRTGWHGNEFVLPNLPATADDGTILRYEPDKPQYCAAFEKRGSLEGWQQQVADHALYSNRMVFAICLAFAAPLMQFAAVEPGGVHLFGKSTKGKSVCLIVASSVTGHGTREDLLNWDVTGTGLEEAAAGHNHSLLCLDETGHLRTDAGASVAKTLRAHAFKLAGGRGRLRSSLWGQKLGVRDLKWRVLFLSTGELSLSDIAAEADLERLKGEEVRLIDLPASNGDALGIYEQLPPGCSSLDEALAAITAACAANCGFAFESYIAQLRRKASSAAQLVEPHMDRFMTAAKVPDDVYAAVE
jgi:putative DNA primase/helicase